MGNIPHRSLIIAVIMHLVNGYSSSSIGGTYRRLLQENDINRRLLSAVSNGHFAEESLLDLNEVEFGVDKDNKAWIYYKDEKGYEFGYHGLEEVDLHLHRLDHHGDTYRLIDDNHMISLVIHDGEKSEVTLSVWTFESEKQKEAFPTFHVTPRALLRKKDLGHHGRKLDTSTGTLLVAYDYSSAFSQGGCSAMVSNIVEDSEGNEIETFENIDLAARHNKRRGLVATPFADCFEDQNTTRLLDISFLTDRGYFNSYDDDLAAVQRSVEVIISNVNLIYFFQFNIHVRLQQLMSVTSSIGATDFLCANNRILSRKEDLFDITPVTDACCIDITTIVTQTSLFPSFSRQSDFNRPNRNQAFIEVTESFQVKTGGGAKKAAHWHLLSDCFPANCPEGACTVGTALLSQNGGARGLACQFGSGRNVAVSSRTFQTWLVVAHELAHNFGGADHSFENGKGRTGGLMDYGDGKVSGVYEFNQLRRNEFCSSIDNYITNDLCREPDSNVQYLRLYPEICSTLPDFTRESTCEGICVDGECVPLQLLVKLNTGNETNPNLFAESLLTEPAEYSPIDINREDEIVTAPLQVASPLDACTPVSDLSDSIAIVIRGGCPFTVKTDNILNANARGMILINNEEGAPKPIGGENFLDISVVGISRNDGDYLLEQLDLNPSLEASIGGFAAVNKTLDFVPISFFEEYFLSIVAFMGVMGITVFYFMLRGRDVIVEKMKKAKENVVDAVIENKYRLMNAYESVRFASVRFAGGRAAMFAEDEELQQLNDEIDTKIAYQRRAVDRAGTEV